MCPTMAPSENPNSQPPPPPPPEISSTPMPTNSQPPRRSRPRVREVSSRFMSPVTKSPSINNNYNPKSHHCHNFPSTPSESHLSKNNYLRRSNTDFRPRYGDENRPDSLNRSSVSPVRSTSKPRSAVKLFKEGSRTDTPVVAASVGPRSVSHRSWDTAASKLLQANGICDSEDGDCDSVKSEPTDNNNDNNCSSNNHNYNHSNSNRSSSSDGGGRVSTPCSRSMEFSFSSNRDHEQQVQSRGGLNSVRGGGGGGKVGRSLNLPPMPPGLGGSRPQTAEGKKTAAVKKGSSSLQDDGHRLKLLHNHYLQWRFANAKAEACLSCQKSRSEKMLYSVGEKLAEMKESVKNKRIEVGLLKEAKTLTTVLDDQMPYLDEWSALEEAYSSSMLELTQGLQNISSRLPLIGNVKVDVKEIYEAMNSALRVAELICSEVQSFTPKAEEVDGLISDLARVHSGEVTLVQECSDLLSRTHVSQIEECSLRGQLIQFQKCNLKSSSKEDQT